MKHRNTKQRDRGNQCETRVEAKIQRNSRISSIWKHSRGFDVGFANETRREIDNFINVEKKKKRNSEKFSNFFEEKGRKEILINFIRPFIFSASCFSFARFSTTLLCPLPRNKLRALAASKRTAHVPFENCFHLSLIYLEAHFRQLSRKLLSKNRLRRSSYTLSRCCTRWQTQTDQKRFSSPP